MHYATLRVLKSRVLKRRILKPLVVVLALSLLTTAFAWGGLRGLLRGGDKTVKVESSLLEPIAETLGVGEIGQTLYYVQEDVVHGTITRTTGKTVPHYYIWICVGDDECLPVDPFTASN
ncbi:MAG: hypothetical protein WD273_07870 [Trueperaceae bacterium]